jgi:hypothetical protein
MTEDSKIVELEAIGIPFISKKNLTNMVLIGQGAYGRVYSSKFNGQTVIYKVLCDPTPTDREKRYDT